MTQDSDGDFVTIIFETHSTSFDNEAGIASGHNDVDLSEMGLRQATGLGERYAGRATTRSWSEYGTCSLTSLLDIEGSACC